MPKADKKKYLQALPVYYRQSIKVVASGFAMASKFHHERFLLCKSSLESFPGRKDQINEGQK